MTAFTFDIPDGLIQLTPQQEIYQRILLDKARRLDESARLERLEEERKALQSTNHVVTFRMPVQLLERFDLVAGQAATSRGHLLRQITADFLNHLHEQGTQYNGTLISTRKGRVIKDQNT